jgi:valyl-tRNA synthetase
MPFITEEIWNALYDDNPPAKSIALTNYPQSRYMGDIKTIRLNHAYDHAVLEMGVVQSVITSLRAERKDRGVPEKEVVSATVYCSEQDGSLTAGYIAHDDDRKLCNSLARVELSLKMENPPTAVKIRTEIGFSVAIPYEAPERAIDLPAERDRLTKDIAKYEKGLAAAERQLGNEAFLKKAPPQVVEGLKKQESETRLLLEKARAALESLSKEG